MVVKPIAGGEGKFKRYPVPSEPILSAPPPGAENRAPQTLVTYAQPESRDAVAVMTLDPEPGTLNPEP